MKSKYWHNYNFILVLFIYFLVCGYFLHINQYLPYVFDNNETYSSLVHAFNMYFGDWGQSFGLTDEAFSPYPEAHPIIHTHQGNWPRIFAFIFFAFGARGPESQIILHLLSIGLVTVWLMYRLFSKVADLKFALVACLVFITDYILFVQWQAVTYRIWHFYFIFATLNCMLELDNGSKAWKVYFVINFIALYYWELIFAFYVSCWSLIFYALRASPKLNLLWIKRIIKTGIKISACGLSALTVLGIQLSLFMGFKNAIYDFYITFVARNFADNIATSKEFLQKFYEDKNIAFFYNIVDGASYKTIKQFFRSIFYYGFEVHTPILSLYAILILMSCCFAAIARLEIQANRIVSLLNFRIITSVILTIFLITLFSGNYFTGLSTRVNGYQILFILFFAPWISWVLIKQIESNLFLNNVTVWELCCINGFMLMSTIFVYMSPFLYRSHYSEIWFGYLTLNLGMTLWRVLTVATVFMGISNIFANINTAKNHYSINGLLKYLLAGFLAYIIIYILSPGYLFSGYLTRYAPFIVFLIDLIFAIFFWVTLKTAIYWIKISFINRNHIANFRIILNRRYLLQFASGYLVAFALISTVIICCYQWAYAQLKYSKLFPGDSFVFVKKLRSEDYLHKSIVANQYSLPFAFETKHWAYTDANIGAEPLLLTNNGLKPNVNYDYLWYRDKKTFEPYLYPEYFVCFMSHSFDRALHQIKNEYYSHGSCSSNRTVSRAKLIEVTGKAAFNMHHKIIDEDVSLGRWSILKMDWDAPPFLVKNDITNKFFEIKNNKNVLYIKYKFKHQVDLVEKNTIIKLYSLKNKKKTLLQTFYAKGGVANLPIDGNFKGQMEIVAIPITDTKRGQEFSEVIQID